MNQLVEALLAMLPGATCIGHSARPWHSATFSGEHLVAILRVSGNQSEQRAAQFADILPEAEFTLRGQLVADVAVSSNRRSDEGIELTVEALLLDN